MISLTEERGWNSVITTEDDAVDLVRECGLNLVYVPWPLRTAKVCAEAVNESGSALEHVPAPLKTPALCLKAMKRSRRFPPLKHVPTAIRGSIMKQMEAL